MLGDTRAYLYSPVLGQLFRAERKLELRDRTATTLLGTIYTCYMEIHSVLSDNICSTEYLQVCRGKSYTSPLGRTFSNLQSSRLRISGLVVFSTIKTSTWYVLALARTECQRRAMRLRKALHELFPNPRTASCACASLVWEDIG